MRPCGHLGDAGGHESQNADAMSGVSKIHLEVRAWTDGTWRQPHLSRCPSPECGRKAALGLVKGTKVAKAAFEPAQQDI